MWQGSGIWTFCGPVNENECPQYFHIVINISRVGQHFHTKPNHRKTCWISTMDNIGLKIGFWGISCSMVIILFVFLMWTKVVLRWVQWTITNFMEARTSPRFMMQMTPNLTFQMSDLITIKLNEKSKHIIFSIRIVKCFPMSDLNSSSNCPMSFPTKFFWGHFDR